MTVLEFNKCVDSFADSLYRFILKHLKNENEAQDIIQDTFEKAWKKHKDISFEKAKSYLFSTAYHLLIDNVRKSKPFIDIDVSLYNNLNYNIKPFDINNIIDIALNKLSDIQKAIILLRDYEGYSYKEISDITGLNESQVKVYIYRARMHLKEFLVTIDNVI